MNSFLRFFETVFWVAMALYLLIVVYGNVHMQIELPSRAANRWCNHD